MPGSSFPHSRFFDSVHDYSYRLVIEGSLLWEYKEEDLLRPVQKIL